MCECKKGILLIFGFFCIRPVCTRMRQSISAAKFKQYKEVSECV